MLPTDSEVHPWRSRPVPQWSRSPERQAASATRRCSGSPQARCSAPTPRFGCGSWRFRPPCPLPKVPRWNSTTAPSPAPRHRGPRRPEAGLRRHRRGSPHRITSPVQGYGAWRPAGRERADLHRAGSGDQPGCRGRSPGAGRRQPRQHERAGRREQRPRRPCGPVHGADPARPQPRDRPAGTAPR